MKTSRQILAEVINITDWLEQDQDTPWAERMEREQKIATFNKSFSTKPYQRVIDWWQKVNTNEPSQGLGNEVTNLFYTASWVVTALGFVVGIGITSALLYYDGSQPINVLMLLSWLILLPFLFFIISLLLPHLRSNHPVSQFNPGSWVLSFLTRRHEGLAQFCSQKHTDYTKDRLLRWRLMLYSQQFGIAMAIAALATLIVRVTLTDLAFGWSTTLVIEADQITPWIQALAFPWAGWFSDAVPSAALIEQSHYFRLDQNIQHTSAETLARWWQYIAMCLLFYGIGIRLMTWLIAHIKYRSALKQLLVQNPEITALLDRLDQAGMTDRQPVEMITPRSQPATNQATMTVPCFDLLLSWNGATATEPFQNSETSVNARSEADLPNDLSSKKRIGIVTKSWEPPLLEFQDFVRTILQKTNADTTIQVIPVPASSENADATDIAIWRTSIESLQEPRVYL